MALNPTTPATTPSEFQDRLAQQLLLQPDGDFLFARWAFGAALAAQMAGDDSFDVLQMELREGRATQGGALANMIQAMSAGMGGPLVLASMTFPGLVVMVQEAKMPGETIKINRPKYVDGATTEANRRIGGATRIFGTNTQPINFEQVDVTIVQYGGPGDSNGNIVPIAVARFAQNRSAHDLLANVGLQLRRDRWKFVDDLLMTRLIAAAVATYYGGGVSSTSAFTAQGAEPMSYDLLVDLGEGMRTRKVPPVDGSGRYIAVLDTHQISDLKKDPSYTKLAKEIDDLNPLRGLFPGAISTIESFYVCESNRMPRLSNIGSPGNLTGYQGLVLSGGALGWGSAEGARLLRDKDDDGGRFGQYAWEAYEGWEVLDRNFVQKVITT
jgi:N4-gp56 family major capsid protein